MALNTFVLHVDHRYMSPYAMSAFVTLVEKGIDFELAELDLSSGRHRESDYQSRSFTGRIPMLSHGDFDLSESSAISEYLEELFPAPGHVAVYPEHMADRARARQIQAWLRSDLMPIREERPTTVIFDQPIDTPLSPAARAAADRLCAAATEWLGHEADQLFGAWSIADTDLALMLNRLVINGDAVPESLARYAHRQWQRPSVQRWLSLSRS
ncbi:MAG: glutathione transferase [Rhizobacter sp.]